MTRFTADKVDLLWVVHAHTDEGTEAMASCPKLGDAFLIASLLNSAAKRAPDLLARALCHHHYVDPTNEVVEASGHEVCAKCGDVKPPEPPEEPA